MEITLRKSAVSEIRQSAACPDLRRRVSRNLPCAAHASCCARNFSFVQKRLQQRRLAPAPQRADHHRRKTVQRQCAHRGGNFLPGNRHRHADAQAVRHISFNQIHRTRPRCSETSPRRVAGVAPENSGNRFARRQADQRLVNLVAPPQFLRRLRCRCLFRPAEPAAVPAAPANGIPGAVFFQST